ncbi:antibiotic biosynthesis monooxygenase [Maritimibacter sp. 55A14]|uniref:putative quinol monooxygenase n=1 Tax=Maritimibacter sp. 55A14 TaxID=2174844 RepID=UPI000D6188C5|nr:putative quinol monooxygenase [Maritimibacter sp. 55A14]PWE33101.1 antibiotic biosynthesis monooxygenase [Maritimibacter sp. 55A14]
MNGEVTLIGHLRATPDDVAAVLDALPEHIRLSRAESGCLEFSVTQDAADPCLFHVREHFAGRAAFEAHQRRTRASRWWGATGHLPRRYSIEG